MRNRHWGYVIARPLFGRSNLINLLHEIASSAFGLLAMTAISIFLLGCGPTYKRETMGKAIEDLAKKEYNLDVKAKDAGETVGVRLEMRNFIGEMVASDQYLWEQIENVFMVMNRVAISSDHPPQFMILDVMDPENPTIHLVFTRYVTDLQKIMVEALSRDQYFDRLLIEFVTGDKRETFDINEFDFTRLMLLSSEGSPSKPSSTLKAAEFALENVQFPDFLARVVANTIRRELRAQEVSGAAYQLREVEGTYKPETSKQGSIKILVDVSGLRPRPLGSDPFPQSWIERIEKEVLPIAAEEAKKVLRSYKFESFSEVRIIEKNSGKLLTIPGK